MYLTGIDAALFGVEDMAAARAFLDDWGVADRGSTEETLCYATRDGCEVMVRPMDDPALPPAMQAGPTLRQVIWGVRDAASLDALAARLEGKASDHDGLLSIADPNGLLHSFRVRQRGTVIADPQDVNGPGQPRRVDLRSQIYDRALPITIGHIVLFVDDLEQSLAFFTQTLGFQISDSYPGHAAFLRCETPGPHHHAFILRRPGNPGLNHVAFTVSNIHEVFGGGLAMSRAGHDTDIGPGRHPISSAYFWYFKTPFGGSFEYYADDDWCTDAWEPREYERRPELFAEWAISGGIDGHSRRQKRAA